MTTGNRREAMMGHGSKLFDALQRTTLDGGKDIIIRALNAYVKKHKGEEGVLTALCDIIGEAMRPSTPKEEPR